LRLIALQSRFLNGPKRPNKSLQPTWLSRVFQVAFFICSRFSSCWIRRLSRHAAELRPLGGLHDIVAVAWVDQQPGGFGRVS
jgi:hypothetical protein